MPIPAIVRLSAVLLAIPLVAGSAAAAPPPPAKWTVMVYISGDNDLERAVVRDIELELAATGSTADVQVVALADRGPGYDKRRGDWQGTLLFHVTEGMVADADHAVADWGERNMGDPQTLLDFVTWTKANYPAERYALYFWGHGWSWHPGWVMEDVTDNDTLDMDEMNEVLPSLEFIDFVGYDGCNMAAIEVQTLWHGYATALAHSQEWVGWTGVEYDVVLAQLSANPDMTADEVAMATSQSTVRDKTWSAVAVDDRFDALIEAVDSWSVALRAGWPANRSQYKAAFAATQDFWQAPMDKDLYDLAHEIEQRVTNPDLKAKCRAVMAAVDSVILYERHRRGYGDAHGITIHQPDVSRQNYDYEYYLTLDFARQTQWDEFLSAYLPR